MNLSELCARPARCAVLNNSDAAELTVIKDCNGSSPATCDRSRYEGSVVIHTIYF
jgi:hypothetical protein